MERYQQVFKLGIECSSGDALAINFIRALCPCNYVLFVIVAKESGELISEISIEWASAPV
jgi:hypothetical protein